MRAVAYAVLDSIAVVSLDRHPLNLISKEMLAELSDALESAGKDRDVCAVVFRSAISGVFSAGSDMKDFSRVADDPINQKILFEDYVLRQIERLPIPTIAEIDGHALGGGFELALACDLRVATHRSQLGLPEVVIGGLGTNGLVRLINLIGRSRALDLVYTGRTITASEALEIGLVNRVVERHQESPHHPESLAGQIARQSRTSLRFAKQLATYLVAVALDAGLDEGIRIQREVFASPDLIAGSTAFLEKTDVVFPSHVRGDSRGKVG